MRMKHRPVIQAIGMWLLVGATSLAAQYNPSNLKLAAAEAMEKYSYDKLRIYPITANRVFIEAHKSVGHYKPLKTGLEDGTVKIIERGAAEQGATAPNVVGIALPANEVQRNGAENITPDHRDHDGHVIRYEDYQRVVVQPNERNENMAQEEEVSQREIDNISMEEPLLVGASDEVNRLFIQNTGKDTVFIMAGEVVKGGKQDRVIAQDMMVPPQREPMDLSVYCVEHGRWSYGGNADGAVAFHGYANVSNTSVRKAAIVDKNQSQVWDKVEEVTVANHAESETQTLNALEKNADYQEELQSYENRFADLPTAAPSVIGVVAVTGDRVIGCDMFATPALFRNAYPDLLKSYASEAITSGATVIISNAAVDKYIAHILDERNQKERVNEKGQMFEQNGKKMHISTF